MFVDQMTGMPFREIRTKDKGTANKAAGKTRLVDWLIDILAVLQSVLIWVVYYYHYFLVMESVSCFFHHFLSRKAWAWHGILSSTDRGVDDHLTFYWLPLVCHWCTRYLWQHLGTSGRLHNSRTQVVWWDGENRSRSGWNREKVQQTPQGSGEFLINVVCVRRNSLKMYQQCLCAARV